MYSIIKKLSKEEIVLNMLPSLTLSFILAGSFYKFGSFSLELVAFLATWYYSSQLISILMDKEEAQNKPH